MNRRSAKLGRLPSSVQALGSILEILHDPQASARAVAQAINRDAAMAALLLDLSNSSLYGYAGACQTIEQALLRLGLDTVRTAIVTAALKQFADRLNRPDPIFMQRFWRRSLLFAHCAEALARLVGYGKPDIAYLCGLIGDLGQAILLDLHGTRYLEGWRSCDTDRALLAFERASFGQDHAAICAGLMEDWHLSSFACDAVRYRHEPGDRLPDAHILTKIVHLANGLSLPAATEESFADAYRFFGLGEAIVADLRRKALEQVEAIAAAMGIQIGDGGENFVLDRLADIAKAGEIGQSLWRSRSLPALRRAVERALYIGLGLRLHLIFAPGRDGQTVEAYAQAADRDTPRAGRPDFVIPLIAGRSAVADAILQNRCISLSDSAPLVDRQIRSYAGAERPICIPLYRDGTPVGGLVAETDETANLETLENSFLYKLIARDIASALHDLRDLDRRVDTEAPDAEELNRKIREAVHEIGNPLSIVGNYLEILRLKLSERGAEDAEFSLIKQEIARAGEILLRLRDGSDTQDAKIGIADINKLVADLAAVFRKSLCLERRIDLELDLAPDLPPAAAPAHHVKQILVNLIKNALEAMSAGGKLRIATSGCVATQGQRFLEISVQDNGPGIEDAIMQNLFAPVASAKGGGHSGLGLSIARKLSDDMQGRLLCKTGKQGTVFQVLVPIQ